ncbi:MAG: universal stress protein [Candidatus Rokubacteria bacterium]|nr:universal stress protein [Candidatus Rokubacteria bacterium]
MKRILVPLDGSRLSEAIVPLAEALARDYDAELLLVRALRTLNSAEAEVKAQEEAEAYLRGRAEEMTTRGLRVEWKVWYDEPDRAIADAARFNEVDLITMTTHGRGGWSRLMFGSVAEGLVRMAPVPVLLVRGELAWRPGDLRKIVVPLDGSERSEAILPVVERLAGPFDLGIELLRAIEPLPAYAAAEISSARTEEMIALEEADAEGYLRKVATPLEAKGLRVTRSVGRGLAVDVILRRTEELGAGLVAMSTHGRTGVGRLLIGSVAERVLRSAPVPVLLWKAPAAKPASR